MLKLEGNDALSALDTTYSIRDALLLEFHFYYVDYISHVQFIFQKTNQAALLKVTFVDIQEFDFYYHKDDPVYVEDYKLFKRTDGLLYLSLDPDNSISAISENDCGVLVAKNLLAEVD